MRQNSAAGTSSARRFLVRKEDQEGTLHQFFSGSQPASASPRPAHNSSLRIPTATAATASAASTVSGRLWTPASGSSRFSVELQRAAPTCTSRQSARGRGNASTAAFSLPPVPMPPAPSSARAVEQRHLLWHPPPESREGTHRKKHAVLPATASSHAVASFEVLPARLPATPPSDSLVVPGDLSVAVNARAAFPLLPLSPSDPVVPRPTLQLKRREVSEALERLESTCATRLAVARKHRTKDMRDPDYDACDEGERALLNVARPVKDDEFVPCKPATEFGSNFGDIMKMFLSDRVTTSEDLEAASARRQMTTTQDEAGNLSPDDKAQIFRQFQSVHGRKRNTAASASGGSMQLGNSSATFRRD